MTKELQVDVERNIRGAITTNSEYKDYVKRLKTCRFDEDYFKNLLITMDEEDVPPVPEHSLEEIAQILQLASNELVGKPAFKDLLVNLYNSDPKRFEKHLPDVDLLITAKDIGSYKKIYSVLRDGLNKDGETAEFLINMYSDYLFPLLSKKFKANLDSIGADRVREVSNGNLAFHQSVYGDIFAHYFLPDSVYFIRYLVSLDQIDNLWLRALVSAISDNGLRNVICRGNGFVITSTDGDKVFLGKWYKDHPALKDYVECVTKILNISLDSQTYLRLSLSSSVERHYLKRQESSKISEISEGLASSALKIPKPEEDKDECSFQKIFVASYFAMVTEAAVLGVDVWSLVKEYSLSPKEIKKIVTIASVFSAVGGFEQGWALGRKQTINLDKTDDVRGFCDYICVLIKETLLLKACLYKSSEGQGDVLDESAIVDVESIKKPFVAKIEILEKNLSKTEAESKAAERSIAAKDQKISEQKKTIKALEKEKYELAKKVESLELAQKKPEQEASTTEDVKDEVPFDIEESSLTEDEARAYVDEILKECVVIVYGARDNFKNKFKDMSKNLKFIKYEDFTASGLAGATMVVLRTDFCAHSGYQGVKKRIKEQGIPFRHAEGSNKKLLYDAIIDMYEHD